MQLEEFLDYGLPLPAIDDWPLIEALMTAFMEFSFFLIITYAPTLVEPLLSTHYNQAS